MSQRRGRKTASVAQPEDTLSRSQRDEHSSNMMSHRRRVVVVGGGGRGGVEGNPTSSLMIVTHAVVFVQPGPMGHEAYVSDSVVESVQKTCSFWYPPQSQASTPKSTRCLSS